LGGIARGPAAGQCGEDVAFAGVPDNRVAGARDARENSQCEAARGAWHRGRLTANKAQRRGGFLVFGPKGEGCSGTVRPDAYPRGVQEQSEHRLFVPVPRCPKYRRQVLVHGVEKRLKRILQEVVAERQAELIELEVMPDHVHALVEVHPQYGIHRLVKTMKGRSSRALRAEFPWLKSRLPALWTNSYFVSTMGGAPLAVIKPYIGRGSERPDVALPRLRRGHSSRRDRRTWCARRCRCSPTTGR